MPPVMTTRAAGAIPEPKPELRSEFQRDRDRIIHSNAFRRLVYKTQVFVNHEGDLYRTRVTHSIEVAQIARSVAVALRLNEPLTEAICLAHDLGHTPFGHAGQDALNECMREYGGFEHNLQSLRVVDELEERYAEFRGLNLTFECREGILKHCSLKNARQLGELGERFIKRQQPGLEAQIANLADEIAYNNHDVDDGIRAQLLDITALREVRMFRRQHDAVRARYPESERAASGARDHSADDQPPGGRLHPCHAVPSLRRPRCAPSTRCAPILRPLAVLSEPCREEHLELKEFLREHVYRHYKVLRMTSKARRVLQQLFEAFFRDVSLMPTEHRDHALQAEKHARGRRTRARSR